jgi:hypothetical protein
LDEVRGARIGALGVGVAPSELLQERAECVEEALQSFVVARLRALEQMKEIGRGKHAAILSELRRRFAAVALAAE